MNDQAPQVPAAVRMQLLLTGFEVSQALYVIAELGVATELLDGPRTVEELAKATGADVDALGRIIRFLVPLDVFRNVEGGIEVTELGRTLAEGPVDSMRGLARYWMETHYGPFSGLLHTVRTGEIGAQHVLGKPFFDWVGESERLVELQNAAMAGGTAAARGDLLEHFELPQGDIVADIGGADGTLLKALLAKHPERTGILFDLPEIVANVEPSDGITVVPGSFFDGVPSADVYVLSCVLHDWSDAEAVRILRNVAQSAAPGARLVLVEMVVPEGPQARFATLVDVVMLAMVGGRERSEQEWRRLLAEGGFTLDRVTSGSGAMSAIEATLA